jgi:membrane fusion protein (multidrug efflux system)
MERLYQDGTVSEQKYRDMKTASDLAQYAYDQTMVTSKRTARDLRECRVAAPIPGIITDKYVNEGELTGPQMVAFVIMQMDKVKVEVDLPEDAYGYIEPGNSCLVTVDAIPDDAFKGVISMIHPTIDAASRTVKITIRLSNPGLRLRSGMTARAKVIQKARDHTRFAPKRAFVTGEEGFFVYKLVSGTVERVPVTVGVEGDGVFEIRDGLVAGDQVVVEGLTGLRDGMAVTARMLEG